MSLWRMEPPSIQNYLLLTVMSSLTQHLYSLHKPNYVRATQHPFLSAAANGSLPPSRLALWLSQDRSYAAHAYPRLIGRIISSIPFSSAHSKSSVEEKKNQRVLNVCIDTLKNVADEVEYFDREAERFGLETDGWKVRKGTRDYLAEMARVGVEGSLIDGLVYVWAMEQVCCPAISTTLVFFKGRYISMLILCFVTRS